MKVCKNLQCCFETLLVRHVDYETLRAELNVNVGLKTEEIVTTVLNFQSKYHMKRLCCVSVKFLADYAG